MARQPTSLEDAKRIVRDERAKLRAALSALAGSRWLTAILATFVIAFGANVLYSPDRLPDVGGLSVAAIGLPPSLDFGYAGEIAGQARAAAQAHGAPSRVDSFLAANRAFVPALNSLGLGVSVLLLLGNMALMTTRRRDAPA